MYLISSWAPSVSQNSLLPLSDFMPSDEEQRSKWKLRGDYFKSRNWDYKGGEKKGRGGTLEESRALLSQDKCKRVWMPIIIYENYRYLNKHCFTIYCAHYQCPSNIWHTIWGKVKSTLNFLYLIKKVNDTEITFLSSTLFAPQALMRRNQHFNFCWVPKVGWRRLQLWDSTTKRCIPQAAITDLHVSMHHRHFV